MKSFGQLALGLIVGAVACYFLIEPEKNVEIETRIDTLEVYQTDTVFVEKKPQYITKTVIKTDTVYIKNEPPMVTARLDTTTYDGAKLQIGYTLPPYGQWALLYSPPPEKIVTEYRTVTLTKYVQTEEPWYKRPEYVAPIAFGLGIYIAK